LSATELTKMGFKVLLYSTPALYVAARALMQAMGRLHATHDLSAISDDSVTFKQFQSWIESSYMERRDEILPQVQHRAASGRG
jgi:hypothetical protein